MIRKKSIDTSKSSVAIKSIDESSRINLVEDTSQTECNESARINISDIIQSVIV